jgi:HK97 family phage major capsid protein
MPELRTFQDIQAELSQILSRSNKSTFDRAEQGRTDALFKLAEMLRAGETIGPDRFGNPRSYSDLSARQLRRNRELRIDPAARAFFSRQTIREEPIVSEFGNLLSSQPRTMNGRAVGQVTQMRSLANLEGRTYTALNTSTGGDGAGFTAPIDFWAEVIGQMKAYDGIFDAARWFVTATGTTMDIPLADDTANVGAVVVENNQVLEGANPAFLQLQFGSASLWSTGRILLSLQLLEDSPVIYDFLVQTFAQRFARGMGAQFIATLLAGVENFSAAHSTYLSPDDLFGLVGSIDAAYAKKGSWLMSLSTLMYIFKTFVTTSTAGDALLRATTDDSGHYLLLARPVYLCDSLDDVGAGGRPILYGDMQRFAVRSVAAEQTVNRYSEVFMPTHRIGFEGVWRVDAALAKASATDAPIKALRMPLS